MWLVGLHTYSIAALSFVRLKVSFAPVNVTVTLESQNVRRDSIEEPSIVRDYHDAANEAEDRFLEGSQRIDIQIVGRFVEQQNVATASQEFGQVDSVAFATG